MNASLWNWDEHVKKSSPLWEKVRTISHNVGEPIINFLEVPGSFIPGVGTALSKLKGLFGADLTISSLNSPHAIRPLDGTPGPFSSTEGDAPVFIDGFDASFTLSHNGKGKEAISLEYVDLCLVSYTPGEMSDYSYQLDGEAIIGAGLMEPLRYFISIDADGVGAPRRSVTNKEGNTELQVAKSPNFFNTDPPVYYSFTVGEPPLIIKVNALALSQGFYELCFRFFYRIAAKELRQYTSAKILLYSGG